MFEKEKNREFISGGKIQTSRTSQNTNKLAFAMKNIADQKWISSTYCLVVGMSRTPKLNHNAYAANKWIQYMFLKITALT